MRLLYLSALLSLLSRYPVIAAVSKTPIAPCTIFSPISGSFYDLNALSVLPLKDGKKAHSDDREESWHAKGYDYGTNFTINFCTPVIEELQDVVGVDEQLWRNVSAYYKRNGETYSIGKQSSSPVFRGRKLVLNYTDGSPCNINTPKEALKLRDYDDDDEDVPAKKPYVQRKSTLISFLCDRDPLSPKASVAFVGASPDECTYFFEVRSSAACGGVSAATQTLGPAAVFGVIAAIAVAVYIVGGCAYQRTVMHQRGWRQLPNYGIWAGTGNFIKDMFIILTSSCARLIPRRKGYNQVGGNGRGRGSEDENRLIDQLDEEWDD